MLRAKPLEPETRSELRRLGARLRKQDDAAAETRGEIRRAVVRAYDQGEEPPAIARAIGWTRVYVWRIIRDEKGTMPGDRRQRNAAEPATD